jgi:endoglucanase
VQTGIGVVIDIHDPFGGPRFGDPGAQQVFSNANIADEFVHNDVPMLAGRFASDRQVVAIDLLNEPKPMDGATLSTADANRWNTLASQEASAIRGSGGLNSNRTLIVESVAANPDWLSKLRPVDFAGQNVVYSFHFYNPMGFTQYSLEQSLGHSVNPANEALTDAMKNQVDGILSRARSWQQTNHARVYVGEFSASLTPGSTNRRKLAVADYLRYVTDRFESYGWTWTYHAYRESPVWDLEQNFGSNTSLWNHSSLKTKWAMDDRLLP